jgi:RNA polymerase sigma-70 factor, ECF subfamily
MFNCFFRKQNDESGSSESPVNHSCEPVRVDRPEYKAPGTIPLWNKNRYQQDSKLMRMVQKRDHAAFSELVRRYWRKCYSIAYRFEGNIPGSEDAVQNTFLKIWQRPELWDAKKNVKFSSWLYRVIINICLDNKKKKSPETGYDLEKISCNNKFYDERFDKKEKQKWLENSILTLPINQQIALNLCFYEELSNREAAEIMNISVKAVQSLIMRGKNTLKLMLNRTQGI